MYSTSFSTHEAEEDVLIYSWARIVVVTIFGHREVGRSRHLLNEVKFTCSELVCPSSHFHKQFALSRLKTYCCQSMPLMRIIHFTLIIERTTPIFVLVWYVKILQTKSARGDKWKVLRRHWKSRTVTPRTL